MRKSLGRLVAALMLLGGIATLAACGDTWRGLKQDTRDNTAAVGRAVEKGGEKIQESVD
jgi:predicted small secreted protein